MQNDLQAVIMQPNFKVQEEPWRSTCRVEVLFSLFNFLQHGNTIPTVCSSFFFFFPRACKHIYTEINKLMQ